MDTKTQEFITEHKRINGEDTYGYTKTVYIGYRNKMIVTCKTHGDYLKIKNQHLADGCNDCKKANGTWRKKLTTLEYIHKVSIIHNNFYNYSETIYDGSMKELKIICPVHGIFVQVAQEHYTGGCIKCGYIRRGKQQTTSHDDFIKGCIAVHGDTYNYYLTVYKRSDQLIIIICKIHGVFLQVAQYHRSGSGCTECFYLRNTKTLLQFKLEASQFHNNIYSYDKSIYINSYTPLTITCKIHGDFRRRPDSHLTGSGCPECKSSRSIGELFIETTLIKMGLVFDTQVKVPTTQRMSFDFKIIYNGRVVFLEYDGLQHFSIKSYLRNKGDDFKRQRQRDLLKNYILAQLGIQLIRIDYRWLGRKYKHEQLATYIQNILDMNSVVLACDNIFYTWTNEQLLPETISKHCVRNLIHPVCIKSLSLTVYNRDIEEEKEERDEDIEDLEDVEDIQEVSSEPIVNSIIPSLQNESIESLFSKLDIQTT